MDKLFVGIDLSKDGCKACILNIEKILLGYESTSVYGWHLQYFLADPPKLIPFAPSIICFNTTIIESFKKTLGDLPKTDRIDAFAVAERLRFGRLPESVPVDFRNLVLQRLPATVSTLSKISFDSMKISRQYPALDQHGKTAVWAIMDVEYARCTVLAEEVPSDFDSDLVLIRNQPKIEEGEIGILD